MAFIVLHGRVPTNEEAQAWATEYSQTRVLAERKMTGTAGQKRVPTSFLEALVIPVPPVDQQRNLIRLLQASAELSRIRRYALELSNTLASATFLELFADTGANYPTPSIRKLAADKPNAIRTGPFGSQLLHGEFSDTGVAVLGIDNAVNNHFDWGQRRFITPEKYKRLQRYTAFPRDVIITIMGTCGRCAIVPDDISTAINTKHLCCITLDLKRCLPIYLHAAFLHHPFVRAQLARATKGAIMEGLNMGIIQELQIPLPPLTLQQKYAELVKRHESLRAAQHEALRQAEHLFQTLLRNAFSNQH